MTDIVMVTYQRKKFTKKVIKHLHERTKTSYRLFVVDNNSTDGTKEMLKEYENEGIVERTIYISKNSGIHAAHNIGAGIAKSKYYISTDNDCLCPDLEPDWITQLKGLMDRNPSYGAISCRPQILVGAGGREWDKEPEVVKFNHIGAHLRMMRTKAVKASDGWADSWNSKRNSEDRRIASSLKALGYKVGYANNIRCWHEFGENWGYGDMPIEEHGHREIWPPPEKYDERITSFDTKTWRPET